MSVAEAVGRSRERQDKSRRGTGILISGSRLILHRGVTVSGGSISVRLAANVLTWGTVLCDGLRVVQFLWTNSGLFVGFGV